MNISLKFFKLSLALVIASSFLSCDVEDNESYTLPALSTITEFVESNSDLTNLAAALSAATASCTYHSMVLSEVHLPLLRRVPKSKKVNQW